jgi:hypothetical protein
MPTAQAFDHHDGQIQVLSVLYLVNENGIKKHQTFQQIDYDLRSEWLNTYGASDASGNTDDAAARVRVRDDSEL